MIDYEYRPIMTWPGKPTKNRQRSRFKASYSDTLDLLERELAHLGAKHVVLQVALPSSEIRLDGRPRAGARPSHPGVILSFDSKHGPLNYPCDSFDSLEDNIRAIALSLEHLRAVDRYGVTQRGEQYAGWSRLPPPVVTDPPMDANQAAHWLIGVTGVQRVTSDTLDDVYRAAVKKTHPDMGGNAANFAKTQQARRVLEKHWESG